MRLRDLKVPNQENEFENGI